MKCKDLQRNIYQIGDVTTLAPGQMHFCRSQNNDNIDVKQSHDFYLNDRLLYPRPHGHSADP